MEKFDGRGKSRNINKLRNLPQYKNMSDDEIRLIVEGKEKEEDFSVQLEKRIKDKLDKFEEDYDLSDLKINDHEVLRGMIQSIIALEDHEQTMYNLRTNGITPDNVLLLDKLSKICSDLRKDISNAQNDLSITRKHRKSDRETSTLAYIENLIEKGHKFYQSRMSYMFCPKCNTLLGTIWTLYPESGNSIKLTCQQKDKNGKPCGNVLTITTKEMMQKRGTNNTEVMPDSML